MIDTLEQAAISAGELLMEYFKKGVTASYKTAHNDLITEADIASQDRIQNIITTTLVKQGLAKKDIGFLGEEKLLQRGRYQFIIDPLDGTVNFASGFKHFCVSIAVAKANSIFAGVIYNPCEDVLYSAEKGKGAFRKSDGQKKRLQMENRNLKDSLISILLSKKTYIAKRQLQFLSRIHPLVRGIRSTHATALDICYCAENIYQFNTHPSCSIWDITGAKLILEESGGMVIDLAGKPIKYDFTNPNKIYNYIALHPDNISILKFLKL